MATDWIKMRKNLTTDPRVVRISSALKADILRTIGALFAAWCVFDEHSEDGTLNGYTYENLDTIVGVPGLSEAMESVGWISRTPQGIVATRFADHMGQSAKRRAQDVVRKMSARKADKCPLLKRTKSGLEREKEKEETPPTPPRGENRGGGDLPSGSGRGGNPLADEARESGAIAARFVEHFPSVNERAGWSRLQFDKLGEEVARRQWDMAKFDAVMARVRDLPRDARYPTPTPREVFGEIKKQAARDYAAQGGAA